jgi:hypothetical protein
VVVGVSVDGDGGLWPASKARRRGFLRQVHGRKRNSTGTLKYIVALVTNGDTGAAALIDIARAIGIWAFGLLASALAGSAAGGVATTFWGGSLDAGLLFGMTGGMSAFACVRLWCREPSAASATRRASVHSWRAMD